MNHDQHRLDEQERQMLEHFRQHSVGEPSAQLDAQILAAASAAARSVPAAEVKPGLSARLHNWLFGAGGRQRWSVALAGVACLGIGVSLTWRTFEQAPDAFDAVPSGAPMSPAAAWTAPQAAPMSAPLAESAGVADEAERSRAAQPAPVSQGYSSDSAEAKEKLSVAAPDQLLREESAVDALQPQAARAPAVSASEQAAGATGSQAEQQLRSELQRLLKLRRDGWTDEADALLLQLMREHPEVDIDAQLQHLQAPD
ncbi:hypothetical protein DBR00_12015 [Pseudomonas sp. HMWF032]|uniref:hypothetical protein n=1 Tax=unclassified Pseudomonas TaxID=196821 RepID=UPI000D3C8FE9|nr:MULTISPECIES: hypothetical protein [unclassified Pseudomonas]PTS84087.1 hypothetical protein DBR00_12015 [Pseudomonas sp. HMWF032]PTT85443.1 hypothetical protein DBR41_04600 [Pseudomonas sp. HMWF010]WAC43901.1 hypothetical protein OU997_16885 [Pseudomonas sp. SL4(2022)]